MKKALLASVFGAAFIPSAAWAEDNLLSCIDRGFVITQCALPQRTLEASLVEGDRTYEADYLLEYAFPCQGHAVQLFAKAGNGLAAFQQGIASGSVTVTGAGDLVTYSPDPNALRTAAFRAGCKLVVSRVTKLPSSAAVLQWSDEAKSLGRIIDLSVQRYLLAKDYLEIAQWNRDKLLHLKGKLESLVVVYPTNLHYKTMLNHVNATLANQPSSVTLAELTEAGEDVRVTLRRELDADVAQGRALVDRFQRWQQQAEATLQDVLNHIPAE